MAGATASSPQPSPPEEERESRRGCTCAIVTHSPRQWGRGEEERRWKKRLVAAFTLIELLVVIAIIGILAALVVPVAGHFKPNVTAAATRQLLDDIGRARHLAISQRTTVFMVFVPPGFFNDDARAAWSPTNWMQASNLFDKQMVSYSFATLRSLGDQPGQPTARYLSSWKTLPEGVYIPWQKFAVNMGNTFFTIYNNSNGTLVPAFNFTGFDRTYSIPFPSLDTPTNKPLFPFVYLPYIAFDYMGRLVYENGTMRTNAVIPLARGSILFAHDQSTKMAKMNLPVTTEIPIGNYTNDAFNLVWIDGITGHAHSERKEAK